MDGMEFWIATVSDGDGLYASELIWCDGDREYAWQSLGSESEVRQEARRLGIPARLDGPFTIGGPQAVQDVPAAPTTGIRYTVGPWHREPLQSTHGADIAIVAPANGWVVAVIQHDPDIQTCEEPDGDSVVWHPQDLGNADLICEGPAMVDALRKAESALTGDIFTDAEECAASVENARAVAGQVRTILARIDGTATPAAPDDACGQCEGTGTISGGLSGDGDDEECPVCDGSGKLPQGDDEGVDHVECAAALVRDGLVLLDAVEHVDDGALADGRLMVIPAAGQAFRVCVALAGEN